MGNSSSSGIKWDIILDHEDSEEEQRKGLAIVAGHTLKGKAIAQVEKGCKLHNIFSSTSKVELHLMGKEKSRTIKDSGRKNVRKQFGEHIFASTMIILREGKKTSKEEEEQISKLTTIYTYPFSIKIPKSLPSTVRIGGRKSSYYAIQYTLRLLGIDSEKKTSAVKLMERTFSIVSSPLPNESVPIIVPPESHDVQRLGKGKGSLLIGAQVLDAHVGRGTELQVSVAVRNEATVTIQRIEMKLLEHVTWSTRGDRNSETRTLSELHDISIYNLPGIMKRKQDVEEIQNRILSSTSPTEDKQNLLNQIYNDLKCDENHIILPVPYGSNDSYNGRLGKISHYIQIILCTKSLVNNPTIKIPIRIGFPPRQLQTIQVDEDTIRQIPTTTTTTTTAFEEGERKSPDGDSSSSSLSSSDLPIAKEAATRISITDSTVSSIVDAPLTSVPPEAFVLGGTTTMYAEEKKELKKKEQEELSRTSISSLQQQNEQDEPSIRLLLKEMEFSIKDYDIIVNKLEDPKWFTILSNITVEEFGQIIKHVDIDIDQHRIAKLLAKHIITSNNKTNNNNNNKTNFTCQYCVSAIRNCSSESYKITMIEKLLPYCTDLLTNYSLIRNELSEWEQTVTNNTFEQAITKLLQKEQQKE